MQNRVNLKFYKYEGNGNDFIMVDSRKAHFPFDDVELIKRLCDRHYGIGADGLIVMHAHKHDYEMWYANSDGKPSSMCGNGGRCFAAFAHYLELVDLGNSFKFTAPDGVHEAIIHNKEWISLKMIDVKSVEIINEDEYVLNTGSPHYVKLVNDLKAVNIIAEAHQIRHSERFTTEGINVNFVVEHLTDMELKRIDKAIEHEEVDDTIRIRTYERGVENETLACGTGATAAALVKIMLINREGTTENHKIMVMTEGGHLIISAKMPNLGSFTDVYLSGAAKQVFKGEIKIGETGIKDE